MMNNIIQNIQDKLSEMEQVHDCRILFAIESGSRSWGYASATSDYDVRCVYYRPQEKYLSVKPMRDVIEWELNDVYDINGWDLKKALQLALRSNISVYEWADSPIVYRSSVWHEEFRDVTRAVMQPAWLATRYVGMAESTYKRYLTMPEPPYKEYFYALRPLLAARWVMETQQPAPVPFADLRHLLAQDMQDEVDTLLALRASHTEKAAAAARPKALEYIRREIAQLRSLLSEPKSEPDAAPVDAFFRRVIAANS